MQECGIFGRQITSCQSLSRLPKSGILHGHNENNKCINFVIDNYLKKVLIMGLSIQI